MRLSMIVATGLNGEIGLENKLLWHIKEDLQFFKQKTLHHFIVMGRKTFESIGKPLPSRTTFVLTKNEQACQIESIQAEKKKIEQMALQLSSIGNNEEIDSSFFQGVIYITDPLDLFDAILSLEDYRQEDFEVFICGGEYIYKEYLPYVQTIYKTQVNYSGKADAYFPPLLEPEWSMVSEISGKPHPEYIYSFQIWKKN